MKSNRSAGFNKSINYLIPQMGFFCSVCQKGFKLAKTYDIHIASDTHKVIHKKLLENPKIFKRKLSKCFITHFASFISNLEKYTEINIAYQQYLGCGRYRIKGTVYKGLHECVKDLSTRVSLQQIDGAYYVKRNMISVAKHTIQYAELNQNRNILG
ncbi:hypothetical protein PAEPH01_0963 [Pancytospora epiphaga]|nr:hypothetical protein PAEPH01_0963 [Pancytospora epiphaga]